MSSYTLFLRFRWVESSMTYDISNDREMFRKKKKKRKKSKAKTKENCYKQLVSVCFELFKRLFFCFIYVASQKLLKVLK